VPLGEQCFPCRRVLFDDQSMCARAQSAKDVNTPGTSALAARMCASCRRRSLSGDPTDSSGEGHARRAFRRSCGGGWLHEGNLAPNMGSPLCDSGAPSTSTPACGGPVVAARVAQQGPRSDAARDAVGEVGCGRASWAPCLRTGARRSWTEEPDDGWMALGECERITPNQSWRVTLLACVAAGACDSQYLVRGTLLNEVRQPVPGARPAH